MTIPEFKPIAWTNKQGDYFEAVRKDTVFGSHTRPLYTSDQLAEAYEAGKREQAAELAAEQAKNAALRDALNRLQEACNGEDDNEFYAANSAATKYLSTLSDTSALESYVTKAGEKMQEKTAQMLLNGHFLHDQAPGAILAREAAKAIRALPGVTLEDLK